MPAPRIKKTGGILSMGALTTDLVGLHGAAVAQRAGAAQASVTLGTGAAVAGTGATNSTPYGYSQAQADAIVTNINTLRADNILLAALVNELRAALIGKGVIKGAA